MSLCSFMNFHIASSSRSMVSLQPFTTDVFLCRSSLIQINSATILLVAATQDWTSYSIKFFLIIIAIWMQDEVCLVCTIEII